MTKIPKLKILFLLATFCFLLSLQVANAAQLDIFSQTQEIDINQQFQVDVVLNTEGEEINATEGKIIFPIDLLELKEIRDGNSIINFWIERPKAGQLGIIGFSGIIPGGYQETKGFLFSIVFQAKASGDGAIEIRDAKVLLNDGKGTETSIKLSLFQFSISQEAPAAPPIFETAKDTDPPEDFKPEIAQSPEIFNGSYFLVFAAQDKGSGIDYYEVCEGSKKKCVIAESPYLLQNQKLDKKIFVKAVDKSGNEKITVVEPRYPIKWYEIWWIWGIIIVMIFIGYVSWKIFKLKIKSQKSK